jgi:hypothetical protein
VSHVQFTVSAHTGTDSISKIQTAQSDNHPVQTSCEIVQLSGNTNSKASASQLQLAELTHVLESSKVPLMKA